MNNLGKIRRPGIIILYLFLLIIYGCGGGGGGSGGSPPAQDTALLSSITNSIGAYSFVFTNTKGESASISGSIRYQDKLYNNNGFTGTTTFNPVRFAAIELVRSANPTQPGVYVRVIAETDTLLVKNNVTDNAVYAVKSATIDDSSGIAFSSNIDITVSSGAGGAFNILDVLTNGVLYLEGLTGTKPPKLTAFWETNSCDGTYTDSLNNSIHILGGCKGDTDEYDDDIILHEFGHFAAANFSRDDSPGGDHSLNDNAEDIRLAWSEGWAHFFSSAIRGNPNQVDTVTTLPGVASSFEIETPSLPFSSIYTTSEVSVAAILWDIFDSGTNETFDTLSLGISPIWDVFSTYLVSPSVSSVSIEDFWDGWFIRGHNNKIEMLNIIKDRKMELFEDSFEPDNSPNTARKITIGTTEHHTLYPIGDKDIVAFDVVSGQTYTIETINLTNGTDTYLEILNSNGTTIIKNNDNRNGIIYTKNCQICPPNDSTTLSSKVSITATSTGTIFASVSRSPFAPDSAGAYGSYDLKISSP